LRSPAAVAFLQELVPALLHALAELVHARKPRFGGLRQHLRLFLIYMALHVFDENVELGVEILVAGLHLHQLVHQLIGSVVLLLGTLDDLARAVALPAKGRVKDLLLEDGVNVQLDERRFGGSALGRRVLGLFELTEQLFHLAVVFAQHLQRVHA
jgi:hypothetical protein